MAKAKKKTAKTRRAKAGAQSKAGKAAKRGASARRNAAKANGPSIPLRELIRDGMPRSKKAHHPPGMGASSPWAHRRTRTAHGLRSGTTIMQNQPPRLEHVGSGRIAIPKR